MEYVIAVLLVAVLIAAVALWLLSTLDYHVFDEIRQGRWGWALAFVVVFVALVVWVQSF